jgi:hypothetical protein
MKSMVRIIAFLILIPATFSFSHPGGLDANGGHTNRKTGDYHYHRAPGGANKPIEQPQKSIPETASVQAPEIKSSGQVDSDLRSGVTADSATLQKAAAMKKQGWIFIMPKPKSPQAAWGNRDGRTTWWIGYWENKKANDTSAAEPILKNGLYTGDGKGQEQWQ